MDDVGSYSLCSRLQASKPFPSPEFRTILLAASVVKETRLCVELHNEIVDLVNLVLLIGTFSKDINLGYHAVSSRKSATFDNDLSLS